MVNRKQPTNIQATYKLCFGRHCSHGNVHHANVDGDDSLPVRFKSQWHDFSGHRAEG